MTSFLTGLTSALGDEINAMAGRRLTRLLAIVRAEEKLDGNIDTADSDVAGVVITLASGLFGADVVPGRRFRVLSGAIAGESALIAVGGAGTNTLDLVGVGLSAQLADASWEVVRDADTSATVESTAGLLPEGRVYIADVLYTYGSKTGTTLDGLEHWDGEAFVVGAKREHAPLEEVVDVTRATTTLDILRRALFVNTADGTHLNVAAANVNVPRPPELTDEDIFRRLVMAVAFAPRGIRHVVAAALEVVFGANGYELFEEPNTRPGKLYARRIPDFSLTSLAKAYLSEPELYLPATVSTASVDAPNPIGVVGVRLADDNGERLVQASEILATGTYNAGTGVNTVNLSLGVLSVNVKAGDWFVVLRGPTADLVGTVKARVSASQLTLGQIREAPSPGAIPRDFVAAQWKIVRPLTNCRIYKPSADITVDYRGDPGTQAWTYVGSDEAGDAVLTSNPGGKLLAITSPGGGDTAAYTRLARVTNVGYAEMTLVMTVASLSSAVTSVRQATVSIWDGTKSVEVGFRGDGAGNILVGFINNATTELVASYSIGVSETWFELRLIRDPLGDCEIWINGIRRLSLAYSNAAHGASGSFALVFGATDTVIVGAVMSIKTVQWLTSNPTDFWNRTDAAGTTTAPDRVLGAFAFVAGDIGKRIRVDSVTALNASDGSALGSWEIAEIIGANQVRVVGSTQHRLQVERRRAGRLEIRGRDDAFRFPDRLGYHVNLLTGRNTGDRTITAFIGRDGRDLATVSAKSGPLGNVYAAESTSIVDVTSTPEWVEDGEVDWRFVPLFPADAGPCVVVLENRGVLAGAGLTFGQALPAGLALAVLAVDVVRVRSAVLVEDNTRVTTGGSPGPLSHFAFVLADSWGYLRRFLPDLLAAGYELRFDELYRDEAGLLHIADLE